MSKLRHLLLKSIILVGVLWSISPGREAYMQSAGTWSLPLNVSQSPGTSTTPYLVADRSGAVHLFWAEDIGGDHSIQLSPGNALMYGRWWKGEWSEPTDILVSPDGGLVASPVSAIDSLGVLHVVWAGSTGLYYSHADALNAQQPSAWEAATWLAPNTSVPQFPVVIAVDNENTLHIIYTTTIVGQEVLHIVSRDGGQSWSTPVSVSTDMYMDSIQALVSGGTVLKIAADGRLHVGWSMYNNEGFGEAIFYANSSDGGLTWSKPFLVATKGVDDYEADWLEIATVGSDEIHLVWAGRGHPPGRSHRLSMDGGMTWGETEPIMEGLVGETGALRLVVDAADTVHLFVPSRSDITRKSGMRHLFWRNGSRSTVTLIPGRPPNPMRYSCLEATATMLGGNHIFVAWNDQSIGDIMVVENLSEAPAQSPVPFPTSPTPTTEAEAAVSQETAVPTAHSPISVSLSDTPVEKTGPAQAILLSVISPLLLVSAVVAMRLISRRRR